MDCSMPGFPVLHHLLELAQTHVHWVSDAIQPSNPLSSPSPPAFNLSQHQGLFQWVGSSHQMTQVLEYWIILQDIVFFFCTTKVKIWSPNNPLCVCVCACTRIGGYFLFSISQWFYINPIYVTITLLVALNWCISVPVPKDIFKMLFGYVNGQFCF